MSRSSPSAVPPSSLRAVGDLPASCHQTFNHHHPLRIPPCPLNAAGKRSATSTRPCIQLHVLRARLQLQNDTTHAALSQALFMMLAFDATSQHQTTSRTFRSPCCFISNLMASNCNPMAFPSSATKFPSPPPAIRLGRHPPTTSTTRTSTHR